jgi:hypothetical protein
MKSMNTMSEKMQFLIAKAGGTYSIHYASNGLKRTMTQNMIM